MDRRHRGVSYVELTAAVGIVAALWTYSAPPTRDSLNRAMDARVGRDLSLVRTAWSGFVIAHDGRSPRVIDELRPFIVANRPGDIFVWAGSGGRGRMLLPRPGVWPRLVSDGERLTAGKDQDGKSYADY